MKSKQLAQLRPPVQLARRAKEESVKNYFFIEQKTVFARLIGLIPRTSVFFSPELPVTLVCALQALASPPPFALLWRLGTVDWVRANSNMHSHGVHLRDHRPLRPLST
jgi:hypothetical protein